MATKETNVAHSSGRAAVVAAGPVLLLGAMLWHPPLVGRLPDPDGVAEAAADGITRWGLAHLATGVASAAIAVAFMAVHGYLKEQGDRGLSEAGLGFVIVGSTLYAVLPGMEFAILAAHETGASLVATQEALDPWFIPTLVSGSVVFLIGSVLFAVALVRRGALRPELTVVVAAALVVFGLSRLIPVGAVQFYVQPVAALIALMPLAAAISVRSKRENLARTR